MDVRVYTDGHRPSSYQKCQNSHVLDDTCEYCLCCGCGNNAAALHAGYENPAGCTFSNQYSFLFDWLWTTSLRIRRDSYREYTDSLKKIDQKKCLSIVIYFILSDWPIESNTRIERWVAFARNIAFSATALRGLVASSSFQLTTGWWVCQRLREAYTSVHRNRGLSIICSSHLANCPSSTVCLIALINAILLSREAVDANGSSLPSPISCTFL